MVNSMIDIPRKGLVLYLDLTEPTGNIIYDRSGHGHNARVYGAVLLKQLPFRGRYFDGVDDYGTGPSIDLRSDFTIVAMVKPMKPSTLDVGYDIVVERSGYYAVGIIMRAEADGVKFGGTYYPDENRWFMSGAIHPYDDIYVVALRQSAVGGIDLIVNDDREYSNTNWTETNTLVASLTIAYASHLGTYFRGEIAYVLIYNRALSSREIKQIYEELQKRVTRRFVTYSDIRVR